MSNEYKLEPPSEGEFSFLETQFCASIEEKCPKCGNELIIYRSSLILESDLPQMKASCKCRFSKYIFVR